MKRPMHVLLINPYLYDVSAYGFWSAPLGLLYMGSILRQNGCEITLIDCVRERDEKRKEDGRAPYVKQRVPIPELAQLIDKPFRRYGMSREDVRKELVAKAPPDLVLLTGIMTYWCKGVAEIAELVRQTFPKARIALGGLYAQLCHEQASVHVASADLVVGRDGMAGFYAFVEESFGLPLRHKPGADDIDSMPYPAFDLYGTRHFVPLLTSLGCAYSCAYCATSYLRPRMVRRKAEGVLEEIRYWQERGIARFALYDDSFLSGAAGFSKPLLRGMGALPAKPLVYNPNALNASLMDGETAVLLKEAGFQEVRLGLETIDPLGMRALGGKVDRDTFEGAVKMLLAGGFRPGEITAYVLAGLPLQRWEDVKETVDYGAALGIRVSLAEYTPIPHTELFERYHGIARYPIAEEPMFQNNALFPFAWEGFTEQDMEGLKAYVREKNRRVMGQ